MHRIKTVRLISILLIVVGIILFCYHITLATQIERGWKSCYKCNQTGLVSCPVCTGTGVQPNINPNIEKNKELYYGGIFNICTNCSGSGVVSCPICGGSGKIQDRDKKHW